MRAEIFREYDIRGIVGEQLDDEAVSRIGRAVGTFFRQNNATRIAVGFDARESSEGFCRLLVESLNESGCDCVILGRITTPMLYFTTFTKDVDGGVMITGSHNPSHHNGFKISLGKTSVYGDDIREIRDIAFGGEFAIGGGSNSNFSIFDEYLETLKARIDPLSRPLRVVIDAGNGMGGFSAVPLYRSLGCEVVELFCEPDSSFPNHQPDPSQEKNLTALQVKVIETKADIGIAFDGDGDRITIVDETARIIWGDELMILLAHNALSETPQSTIIAEVKCTRVLFDEITRLGGKPIMSKAGHSIIKAQMKEHGAILGGEMSGHIFFADRFFGFDDACYAGARVLEIVAKSEQTVSQLFAGFPKTFSTPEIRLECPEELKALVVSRLYDRYSTTNPVDLTDGIRITFEHGWGLVRPSNTQALLILRLEADTEAELEKLTNELIENTKAALL
jgi:phosphomannomutase/phosphoglucomutase